MTPAGPDGAGGVTDAPDLGAVLAEPPLDEQAARELWTRLTGWRPETRPDAWDAYEEAVTRGLDDRSGLHVRPGGWSVDLAGSTARAVVAAALVAGALWPAGLDQLPAYVLPSVLPLLFDLERCRLTRGDWALLVELRLALAVQGLAFPWPAVALYTRLPAHVRSQVPPGDFEDFVQALVRAGEADDAGLDEVRVRAAGQRAWLRVSVR